MDEQTLGIDEVREALQRSRTRRKLSLADVAGRAGVRSPATVFRVLRKGSDGFPESAQAVAGALGFELVELPRRYVLRPRRARRAK